VSSGKGRQESDGTKARRSEIVQWSELQSGMTGVRFDRRRICVEDNSEPQESAKREESGNEAKEVDRAHERKGGEAGPQLPAFQRGQATVFIRFRIERDRCMLRATMSAKGGEGRKIIVKLESYRRQGARRRKQEKDGE